MRSSRYRRWHLDKIFVKLNEVEHDLGRAVDQAGEFLESFVTKRRDKSAILKFLRKLLGRHGLVEATVTDHLASYGAAMKTLGVFEKARGRAQVLQACREFPPTFRRRERATLRFRWIRSLQKFAALHGSFHNEFASRPFGSTRSALCWLRRSWA